MGLLVNRLGGCGPVCCATEGNGGGGGGFRPASRFNKMMLDSLAGRVRSKVVLVRVDFNVSDEKTGEIKSDTRIKAAVPTINFLRMEGAIVVLISHNGRPKDIVKDLVGKGIPEAEAQQVAQSRLSLKKAAERLQGFIGLESDMFLTSDSQADPIDASLRPTILGKNPGEVVLLENVRFYKAEESKAAPDRLDFARKIVEATGAAYFVLDGFSVAHRDQASVTGVAKLIKERSGLAVAGYLLQREIDIIGKTLLENPRRPYLAVMGGAKVADKIQVITNLLARVDRLAIGGAMLFPFLKAVGLSAGSDPLGRSADDVATEIAVARALLAGDVTGKILLLKKVVATNGEETKVFDLNGGEGVPDGYMIRDVAPEAVEDVFMVITPQTVVWNGPLGRFEDKPFNVGTNALVGKLSGLADQGATVVTGGGDSEKAVKKASKDLGISPNITHISTGGGAMLEMLEGKELPGITGLNDLA